MLAVHSPFDVADRVPLGRLDIVVVNYDTPELLNDCLQSIREHGGAVVRDLIVVDNSVGDAGADLVRHTFPDARLLRQASNVGYGAAANAGIAAGTAEFALVLNADTCVTPGAVEALIDELDRHSDSAVVGPRLLDHDGRRQPSCARFPRAAGILLHETGLWKLFRRTSLAEAAQPFFEPAESAAVPWVLGAAFAVRRRPFEAVGGFDRSFFMYYEDVDLCRRLADAGGSTRFSPLAVVHHVGGASTAANPLPMQRVMYKSLAQYMRRHGRDRNVVGLRAAVIVVALGRMGRDVLRAVFARQPQAVLVAAKTWTSIINDAVRGWT